MKCLQHFCFLDFDGKKKKRILTGPLAMSPPFYSVARIRGLQSLSVASNGYQSMLLISKKEHFRTYFKDFLGYQSFLGGRKIFIKSIFKKTSHLQMQCFKRESLKSLWIISTHTHKKNLKTGISLQRSE